MKNLKKTVDQILGEMPDGAEKSLWKILTKSDYNDSASYQRAHYWRWKLYSLVMIEGPMDQALRDAGIDPDACVWCNEPMERQRRSKIYCSAKCRVAANRAKK